MPKVTMKHKGGPRAGVTLTKELRGVPRHIGCKDECLDKGFKPGTYRLTNPEAAGTEQDPAIYQWH